MKRIFSWILVLLAVLTVLPEVVHASGDTPQTATSISHGSSYAGTLGNNREYDNGVYTGVNNQLDYYYFTLSQTTQVTITNTSSDSGRYSMKTSLLDSSQTILVQKSGSASITKQLEPGRYYILVEYYQTAPVYYGLSMDYCTHSSVNRTTVAPSCTAEGYTLCCCNQCGLEWKENLVPASHKYGSWTPAVLPTCTQGGSDKAVCTLCGAATYRHLASLGHKTDTWIITKAPACTDDGTEAATCSVCGETVTRIIEAIGHSYSDWETTGEATCTVEGIQQKTCGNCGDSLTQSIPALGHTEVTDSSLEPTCTATGLTEGSHCSTCGEILLAQQTVPALGHRETVGAPAVDPTCEETGLTERTDCSVCGEILVPQETIPALGHTEVTDAAKEPTCSQSGKTEGSHCSVCGKTLKAQSYIPTLPHTEVMVPAIEPTCTEPGQTKGKYCSVCKTDLIRSLTLPAAGHQKVIDTPAVAATCTESGMTEGYHCDLCGVVETAKVAQPIPHNYLNGKCVYCGEAGSGWNWEISGTTLTISGTGPMTDFAADSDVPWYDQRANIKTAIVEDGITHIARRAFYSCTALNSVTLPDSVTTIGAYAFSFCSSLIDLTLPENLTEIGDYVFYHSKIRTITIPDSVTRIGNHAFDRSSLSSITIPRNVTSIGEYAFYQCSSLKNAYMSSNITNIGQYAFGWCTYLEYVSLPDNLIELGSYAFYMCEELRSVYMNNGLIRIGDHAFVGCQNLYSVSFPDSVTHIGDYAFRNCSKISYIILPTELETIGDYAFEGCSITSYTLSLPENLRSIGAYAFRKNSFNVITIPAGLTSIGQSAFADCTSLQEIHITDLVAWVTNCSNYCGSLMDGNNYYKSLYLNGELLTKVVIPDGVTGIGKYAFCNCNNITSVTLPDSLTQIDKFAFCYCTNLTDITLPANVRSLGDYAFAYSGLKRITFRGHAPEPFGTNAFYSRYVTAYYPGQDPSWTSSVRCNYGGTVTWVPNSCSGDHTESVDPAVEPTCTAPGWTEGRRCSACGYPLVPRESIPAKGHFVLGPDQTLVSPDTAEPGCTNDLVCAVCQEVLKEALGHRVIIQKPYNVINTAENSFILRGDRYYSDFQTAGITSDLQFKINYSCRLTLNYSITDCGYGCIYILLNDKSKDIVSGTVETQSLTLDVSAGDTLTFRYRSSSNEDALYNKGWITIQYAEDQPQIIVPAESLEPGCAPVVCDYCRQVIKDAPGHTEVIDFGVEATCSQGGLTEGKHCSVCEEILVSQTELPALGHDFVSGVCSRCGMGGGGSVVAEGECGTNVGWKLYDSGLLLISGNGSMSSYISSSHPWRSYLDSITRVVVEAGVTRISSSAFTDFVSLESVSMPEGITRIGDSAFRDCTKLKGIVLPASVTELGQYAFQGCSALEAVTLPEGITAIGKYTFDGCEMLTEVEVPSTVTQIGDYAFQKCSALETVTLHAGLTQIGSYAFSSCSALAEIALPDTVSSIGGSAFYYCSKLAEVSLPDGITSIPADAFYRCSALTEITIPSDVMTIGAEAFYYCRALKQITFTGMAPAIRNDAFFLVWATALYPENHGWQTDDLRDYGGTLTWQSYNNGVTPEPLPEVLASGECGTDLQWALADDGTLTISGNGAIPDYGNYSDRAPWYDYVGWIDQVVIAEGVTAVGNYAFYDCFGVKSVSIGSSVQRLGQYAFYQCENLKEAVIPAGITEVGSCAFYSCEALEKVTLPAGITEISSYAFTFCDSLTEICIPDSVTAISDYAFASCYALAEVIFTGNAPTIAANAFRNVTADVWHPVGDDTWTADMRQDYGGNLTWKAGCADGHTLSVIPGVEPTCTETGLTEGTGCSVCGKVITPQSTIPARGHSYGDPAFEWYTKYSRFNCNAVFSCRNCSGTKTVSCRITEASAGIVGQAEYTATATLNEVTYTDRMTEKHNFHETGELFFDDRYHWYHCAICEIKLANVEHTPGADATENTAQCCTVCGYVMQPPLAVDWFFSKLEEPDQYLWASGNYAKIMEQYGN